LLNFSRGVRDASSFAFTQLYSTQTATYEIISATQQVEEFLSSTFYSFTPLLMSGGCGVKI
jgi:hypothetical protein